MAQSTGQEQLNSEAPSERLYTPQPGEAQLSFRAVAAGCLLGGVVAAMNIYLGLRTGWSVGGSLIAAILGFSIFGALGRAGLLKTPYGVLEANITQTAGSAAGSMTSAAGLLAAIPAMGMLGHEFSYLELTAWAFAVAYLGVFYAVPLRRQMVLVEKLRFPTGTATAEVITAMFSSGGEARDKGRALVLWGVAAGAFTLLTYFVPIIEQPPIEAIGLSLLSVWGFSLLISPLMTGAGLLIGPRVGSSLLLGAIAGWAVLGPYAQSQGWAGGPSFNEVEGLWEGGKTMSYSDGVRGWILWPGVAIMVGDALTSLALSWRTILNTFTGFTKGDGGADIPDVDPDELIPNAWWMGGLLVATCATTVVAKTVFEIPVVFTLLAVALSSVLATIAVRSTGETDINPIGGMGKVTQLVYGGLAPGAVATNLMAAAITGAGASQAGDMMQDLKTGHLLGASPRGQFKAQLFGIGAGILFCIPIYKLFDTAYTIGGEELPAPAAHAWRAMAELLSKGFDALPAGAEGAVLGGLAFGVAIPVIRKLSPSVGKLLPSALAFGIAFIVPAYYSVAMFLGSMVLVAWRKASPAGCEKLAFAVASGLIAGEGLMGIVKAILTLLEVPTFAQMMGG
ncbi:MAG: OPT/YSL family transporter [Alphaproteobacteria bacterium]|nr:OPT/YSL family transporter [Alphaproteobacteria bacterium]